MTENHLICAALIDIMEKIGLKGIPTYHDLRHVVFPWEAIEKNNQLEKELLK
jgi:hypothetical protein